MEQVNGFIVRGGEREKRLVEFWLEPTSCGVLLMAKPFGGNDSEACSIMEFAPGRPVHRPRFVGRYIGLPLDGDCRVAME